MHEGGWHNKEQKKEREFIVGRQCQRARVESTKLTDGSGERERERFVLFLLCKSQATWVSRLSLARWLELPLERCTLFSNRQLTPRFLAGGGGGAGGTHTKIHLKYQDLKWSLLPIHLYKSMWMSKCCTKGAETVRRKQRYAVYLQPLKRTALYRYAVHNIHRVLF